MARYYVEAYNGNNQRHLGNIDGQGVIDAIAYKRTDHYKMLVNKPSKRVKYYLIVAGNGATVERIDNKSFKVTPIKGGS